MFQKEKEPTMQRTKEGNRDRERISDSPQLHSLTDCSGSGLEIKQALVLRGLSFSITAVISVGLRPGRRRAGSGKKKRREVTGEQVSFRTNHIQKLQLTTIIIILTGFQPITFKTFLIKLNNLKNNQIVIIISYIVMRFFL